MTPNEFYYFYQMGYRDGISVALSRLRDEKYLIVVYQDMEKEASDYGKKHSFYTSWYMTVMGSKGSREEQVKRWSADLKIAKNPQAAVHTIGHMDFITDLTFDFIKNNDLEEAFTRMARQLLLADPEHPHAEWFINHYKKDFSCQWTEI